ncbi:hypothetical protein PLESTB_000581400 [Pleodorina starrii]|uniref:Uncharacterized protein n=1 Tax=Pleodorina starrii TaxID=330485 RepID=A0A9W6BI91_9CHLO|nr:hypothetical protein PLESTM_000302900 [Pleodorina starrii]GLC52087.1 hypothetical protein PLESTB_000581400 [Pleodorina starrii]GLC72233.1 hypothetical protein PLESTF_001221900 [Pleodorina starrii]
MCRVMTHVANPAIENVRQRNGLAEAAAAASASAAAAAVTRTEYRVRFSRTRQRTFVPTSARSERQYVLDPSGVVPSAHPSIPYRAVPYIRTFRTTTYCLPSQSSDGHARMAAP